MLPSALLEKRGFVCKAGTPTSVCSTGSSASAKHQALYCSHLQGTVGQPSLDSSESAQCMKQ